MSACGLDASFTCQGLFRDEASPEGYAALGVIGREGGVVPVLWFFEITNVLGMAERRGRVSSAGVQDALRLLRSLPLTVDDGPTLAGSDTVLDLMRSHRLTAYDATYLELARRHGLPLATKDGDLLTAAPVLKRGVVHGRPLNEAVQVAGRALALRADELTFVPPATAVLPSWSPQARWYR